MAMSQKQEELLSISMQVTDSERRRSPNLNVGYSQDGTYVEIIVRFIGSLADIVSGYDNVTAIELLNNYGVIIAPKDSVESIISEDSIEYAEKPKLLYFELANGKRASCITPVQLDTGSSLGLFGEGTIVAVIDTGINPYISDFKNPDGSTRIINIWDQARDVEITRDEINEYLVAETPGDIPGFDTVGHGTNVARIACGNVGVASGAEIIIVKMGVAGALGEYTFPRTTQLMRAVDYCVRKGLEYNKPVAINISFGNNYGDHTGGTLLESYLNSVAGVGKNVICVGSGNEGTAATHTSGVLDDSNELDVELIVSAYETSLDIQIWKEFVDDFEVEIITPTGVNLGRINRYNQVNRATVGNTEVLTYYGEPSPYNMHQEIYINLIPVENYIQEGVWRIRLIPLQIATGRFDMWLPAVSAINEGTGFARPDEDLTFTVPGTAQGVITVGAYDATSDTYATFSGVGYVISESAKTIVKPEIVAPGVDIMISENITVTGTSFATPFVTGSAALLMEWGIVRGNDTFLYNEKLKAYLLRGARRLTGQERPSDRSGWGALCVDNSLSII